MGHYVVGHLRGGYTCFRVRGINDLHAYGIVNRHHINAGNRRVQKGFLIVYCWRVTEADMEDIPDVVVGSSADGKPKNQSFNELHDKDCEGLTTTQASWTDMYIWCVSFKRFE